MPEKTRILVVDDEQEVGTFFRHLLKEQYDVTIASSGREALQRIQERLYDVALLDLKLPDSDGITLLRAIKNRHPQCEVIIMTGYSTVKTANKAVKLGAFAYIEKPFEEINFLEELINRALFCRHDSNLTEKNRQKRG